MKRPYRCRITVEKGSVSTTLLTLPATATVNSTPDPEPEPTYYTVTATVGRHDGDRLVVVRIECEVEAEVIPAGTPHVDPLTDGIYIVRLSDGTVQKVVVRK